MKRVGSQGPKNLHLSIVSTRVRADAKRKKFPLVLPPLLHFFSNMCYEYHGACKAHQHTKKNCTTLIMEGLTKSNFALTWTREFSSASCKEILQFFIAFSLLVISILTRCSSSFFWECSPPRAFTLCKEKLPKILHLKSSSSSQEENFRGYKCFMCWAWPLGLEDLYENKGLPEARSEAAGPLFREFWEGFT